MIRFVFLDLDDTILDFKKAERKALSKALVELGINPTDEILDRYREINISQWKLLELGEITREEVKVRRYRLLFDEFGIDASPEQATAIYEDKLAVGHYFIDGAINLLDSIYGKYKLYLASNGSKRVQDGRLDSAGIRKYFDSIFISQQVGYDKPSKMFFDKCFSSIENFDRESAIIIGDSLSSDIQGGINVGIKTVWYNPHHQQPTVQPDYIVNSLAELPSLLERI